MIYDRHGGNLPHLISVPTDILHNPIISILISVLPNAAPAGRKGVALLGTSSGTMVSFSKRGNRIKVLCNYI